MFNKLFQRIKKWWDSLKSKPFMDDPDIDGYNVIQLFRDKN